MQSLSFETIVQIDLFITNTIEIYIYKKWFYYTVNTQNDQVNGYDKLRTCFEHIS